MIENCKQFVNCLGCPDNHKDYCPGFKAYQRINKKENKDKKRKYFDKMIKDMKIYFKDISYFNNDSYKLILFSGVVFHYYPTTGTLINTKTKFKTKLSVYNFTKYFNFLKSEI